MPARKGGRISYTADAGEAIRAGDAIFICVGTPPKESGEADLSAIDHVARQIANEARTPKLVVEKSTVPARTGLELSRALHAYTRNGNIAFRVASNPEFLREGTAVDDFFHPDYREAVCLSSASQWLSKGQWGGVPGYYD